MPGCHGVTLDNLPLELIFLVPKMEQHIMIKWNLSMERNHLWTVLGPVPGSWRRASVQEPRPSLLFPASCGDDNGFASPLGGTGQASTNGFSVISILGGGEGNLLKAFPPSTGNERHFLWDQHPYLLHEPPSSGGGEARHGYPCKGARRAPRGTVCDSFGADAPPLLTHQCQGLRGSFSQPPRCPVSSLQPALCG